MQTLKLSVTYTIKSGKRDAFLQEITKSGILENIRQEKGCLKYEYLCSSAKPDEILLLEEWETEEDQIAHLKQPHMEQFQILKSRYVIDTELEIL